MIKHITKTCVQLRMCAIYIQFSAKVCISNKSL